MPTNPKETEGTSGRDRRAEGGDRPESDVLNESKKNTPLPTIKVRIGSVVLFVLFMGCSAGTLEDPLPKASMRATPLSFGLHVTPNSEQNPIDPPERFTGYHTGVDYEVTTEELEDEVPVFTICKGKVAYSGFASGYGGVLIQYCRLAGAPVTVLYGHLSLDGLPSKGTMLQSGNRIGALASAKSEESGGNRKHLHLGIHRGSEIKFLGYVQREDDLTEFLNPILYLPRSVFGGTLTPYWLEDIATEPVSRG